MRYLLQNTFYNELPARQKYLYQALSLWNIVSTTSAGFIHLTSIPSDCLDILFIVGHNTTVKNYLKSVDIPEKVIVAITCDGTIHFSRMQIPGKEIYIPFQNKYHYADLIKGDLYGFNFDLTDVEVDLISDLMEIKLYDKQMLKVKALQKYLGDDIKIFSPNEERKTILELIQYKHELFNQKLSDYNSINRENGEFLLPY